MKQLPSAMYKALAAVMGDIPSDEQMVRFEQVYAKASEEGAKSSDMVEFQVEGEVFAVSISRAYDTDGVHLPDGRIVRMGFREGMPPRIAVVRVVTFANAIRVDKTAAPQSNLAKLVKDASTGLGSWTTGARIMGRVNLASVPPGSMAELANLCDEAARVHNAGLEGG